MGVVVISMFLFAINATGEPADQGYEIEYEQLIGAYTIRLWRTSALDSGWRGMNVLTIAAPGKSTLEIDWPTTQRAFIRNLTGTDITGEGNPDLILTLWSGGAHCCYNTVVYDLGNVVKCFPIIPLDDFDGWSDCTGEFEDLDEDGVHKFITCEGVFSCAYCACANFPTAKVIFRYEPEKGYYPASPQFAYLYEEDIEIDTKRVEKLLTLEEVDNGDLKCAVLNLVMDYLYSRNIEGGWEAFTQYYQSSDAEDFRSEIEARVYTSPMFVLPE